MKSLYIFTLILILLTFSSLAYPIQKAAETERPAQSSSEQTYIENASITHHTLNINGQLLSYTATAAYMPLKNEANKPIAKIFFIAYTQDNQKTNSQKPITFAFNGGPGSSSIWLHMGALGPQRVELSNDGTTLPKSYKLIDNEYTWLDFTDIVFVDPVGTGYSRVSEDANAQQFYNMDEDVKIMGEFVRLYVTEYQRWLSPKYIAGESYGTTRAVVLADQLQSKHGMLIEGLVLISTALNFETFSFDRGNDLSYVLIIPSYTAAAWYHDKLSGDLQVLLQKAKDWTIDEYMPALAKGSSLSDSEHKKIIKTLSYYSGLSESYIENNQMRIPSYQFTAELLHEASFIIGQLDSRVKIPYIQTVSGYPSNDPSLFIVEGPFVAVFNNYIRNNLNFKTDIPYNFLSDKINESWTWSKGKQGYVNVTESLTQALSFNEHLRVFVASGYFDLTTPWLSQEYTLTHLILKPVLHKNITHKFYESGHQIYTSTDALEKLTQDVSSFFQHQ